MRYPAKESVCVCVRVCAIHHCDVHSIISGWTWACKSVYTGVCLCVVCSVMCQENRSFQCERSVRPLPFVFPLNIPQFPSVSRMTAVRKYGLELSFQQKPFTHMYVWTYVCAF